MKYMVELETGVYLTDGEGDPPRTLIRDNAALYGDKGTALAALDRARKVAPFRKFKNAQILPA